MKGFKIMKTIYEYPNPIRLEGIASNCVQIPSTIICNTNMLKNRVTIFSYLLMCRGLNYKSNITINKIVNWLGRKPDGHSNGINNKISTTINQIKELKYIDFENEIGNTQLTEISIDMKELIHDCYADKFGVVYIDELEKIINYRATTKTGYQNVDIMLMVFAYLRMMIIRRTNKVMTDEFNYSENGTAEYIIPRRRKYRPDAYNDYFRSIAEELGINEREVSRAVTALKKIGLIYFETMPTTSDNNECKSGCTIFCNMYKREGSYLLEEGKEYYKREIENKRKRIEADWRFLKRKK